MSVWDDLRQRLDRIIDEAQIAGNGARIAQAGSLLERVAEAQRTVEALVQEVNALLRSMDSRPVRAIASASETLAAREATSRRRPPSILLLPAAGPESSRHYGSTVARAVDARVVETSCPSEAPLILERVVDRLAAWGLRDNTRGFPSQGRQPMIWDRIHTGTLALFSDSEHYFCAATVIGKCISAEGSAALWDSPEFRWLIFLSEIRDISVPLGAVIEAAGFHPTYRINRQAVVPREHREDGLWQLFERHGLV